MVINEKVMMNQGYAALILTLILDTERQFLLILLLNKPKNSNPSEALSCHRDIHIRIQAKLFSSSPTNSCTDPRVKKHGNYGAITVINKLKYQCFRQPLTHPFAFHV